MANRPAAPRQKSEDLLSLEDNDGSVYHTGKPPPISDERMLHDYDAEVEGIPQPRISTSHDEFVGSGHPASGLPGGPGHATSSGLQAPMGDISKNYSQTSGLGNYQRYSDMDNDNDGYSDAGGYYAAGGGIDEDNVPGLPARQRQRQAQESE